MGLPLWGSLLLYRFPLWGPLLLWGSLLLWGFPLWGSLLLWSILLLWGFCFGDPFCFRGSHFRVLSCFGVPASGFPPTLGFSTLWTSTRGFLSSLEHPSPLRFLCWGSLFGVPSHFGVPPTGSATRWQCGEDAFPAAPAAPLRPSSFNSIPGHRTPQPGSDFGARGPSFHSTSPTSGHRNPICSQSDPISHQSHLA